MGVLVSYFLRVIRDCTYHAGLVVREDVRLDDALATRNLRKGRLELRRQADSALWANILHDARLCELLGLLRVDLGHLGVVLEVNSIRLIVRSAVGRPARRRAHEYD